MNIRIRFSKFLLQFGSFLQTLPVVIMKPDDLIEFSRQAYAKPEDVESWSEDQLINSGLTPEEKSLLAWLPQHKGDFLLLGVGGGREAIPFAKMGFSVTGVDYIPAMVKHAKMNASERGFKIDGLVQEISNLDVPKSSYDVVWISKAMYSCIPTRTRRINMVKNIASALRPGGLFICQFQCGQGWQRDRKSERLRRIISASPIGNQNYEDGDILWLNVEFLHIFTSREEIESELKTSGLSVSQVNISPDSARGSAICVKLH